VSESMKARDHSEDVGVGGRILLEAQDRDHWWAVVNTVMNLWVP
jgi:hypothetical protein